MPNPTKIMIIRHAEKPVSPPPFGVSEDGTQSQHALTVLGWQRAGALIAFFAAPVVAAIAVPRTLYATAVVQGGRMPTSDVEDFGKSVRQIETIRPLSRRLGITPNQSFAVGDEDSLARTLPWKMALFSSHGNTSTFRPSPGTSRASPDAWPGDRFDVVWVLDLSRTAVTVLFKCRSFAIWGCPVALSGSRVCPSAVEPTTSRNRTVTCFSVWDEQ